LLCDTNARRKIKAIIKITKKKFLVHYTISMHSKINQIERKMKAEKKHFG